jgi:D-3-phosphoglycerate dehydrogenase
VSKPVVLIAEELSPATIDALGGFDVRNVDGTDRPALLARSPTPTRSSSARRRRWMPRRSPRHPPQGRRPCGRRSRQRRHQGRHGRRRHGRQRADVEHHLRGRAHRRSHPEPRPPHPGAHASLAAGAWKRSSFTGTELFEKTVGIIGLGRIGALIAARLQGFGVTVVAYDPYVTPARAQQLGVTLLRSTSSSRRATSSRSTCRRRPRRPA